MSGGPPLRLESFLAYRVNRAAELVSRDFAALYRRDFGLTRPEWRCLATIGQFGRLTATQIGRHSSMHKTKVSRAIRALESRRWLRRVDDEADRRVAHLELTTLGRSRYLALAELARAYEARLAALIGEPGMAALWTALDTIEARLGQEDHLRSAE